MIYKTGAMFLFSTFVSFSAFAVHSEKFEKIPQSPEGAPSEEQLTQVLIGKISETVKETKARDAHPKDHGCMDGVVVKVKDNLGPLQVGVFKTPGQEYSAIIRSSHGSSDPLADDNKKGSHGFALKIILENNKALQDEVSKIEGEEYFLDKKYYKTLDIITINGLHEFMVATVADYPEFFEAVGALSDLEKHFKAIAKQEETPDAIEPKKFANAASVVEEIKKQLKDGTFKPENMAKFAPMILNANYWHLPIMGQSFDSKFKVRPVEAGLMKTIGEVVTYDVLDTSYQSWVPSLLGKDQAVKYQLRPVACENAPAQILKGKELVDSLGIEKDPNRLTLALKARLSQAPTCYELAVHTLKEGSEALVENSTAAWPGRDDAGAYVAVATVTIPQKFPGKELVDHKFCEMLSMNPGHSPLDHKNIGGIQRAREKIYAAIETLRNKLQGNPVVVDQ